jgi:hypothetical protein
MNKEFIPYQQALELKELGFNEECLGYYNIDPSLNHVYFNLIRPFQHEWCLSAPLYQQAFRWFREKHDLVSWIYNGDTRKYFYTILNQSRFVMSENGSAPTYEEAELACLKKLIEIVKNK